MEQVLSLKIFKHDSLRRKERLDKRLVLLAIQRCVEVVSRPLLPVARLGKQNVHIQRRRIDNGGGGVEERQRIASNQ